MGTTLCLMLAIIFSNVSLEVESLPVATPRPMCLPCVSDGAHTIFYVIDLYAPRLASNNKKKNWERYEQCLEEMR